MWAPDAGGRQGGSRGSRTALEAPRGRREQGSLGSRMETLWERHGRKVLGQQEEGSRLEQQEEGSRLEQQGSHTQEGEVVGNMVDKDSYEI